VPKVVDTVELIGKKVDEVLGVGIMRDCDGGEGVEVLDVIKGVGEGLVVEGVGEDIVVEVIADCDKGRFDPPSATNGLFGS
jgi:hypothetical protein